MCGRSFLISSDLFLNLLIYGQNSTDSWRTTRYDDGQSPRNKTSKIQKLAFRCFFFADISKGKEISKWQPINKALDYNFFATKKFFKNHHNCLIEGLAFFPAIGSTRSETKHSPRLQSNTQTHPHTHTQTNNPPPTVGLITCFYLVLFILNTSLYTKMAQTGTSYHTANHLTIQNYVLLFIWLKFSKNVRILLTMI